MWGEGVNLHQSENPIKEHVLSAEEEVALSSSPIPLATDTPLTLLRWYSKAAKRATENCRAALKSAGCCYALEGMNTSLIRRARSHFLICSTDEKWNKIF